MEKLVKMFEGNEIKVKTDEGATLINLAHTAKCCGLINLDRGKQRISWKNRNGVVDKLKKLYGADAPTQYLEEINYILDEIENTDDRNTIYMSTWLSKRLAIECHSDKAMRYKNFLVTLDETREKGQAPNVEAIQVLSTSLPALNEVLTNLVPAMSAVKGQVNYMASLMHDQATIYDSDREDLKNLIGFRSVNTKRLSSLLKERLSEIYGDNIKATSKEYSKARKKIFKEFDVIKWEDIPAQNYNKVHAFIDGLEN